MVGLSPLQRSSRTASGLLPSAAPRIICSRDSSRLLPASTRLSTSRHAYRPLSKVSAPDARHLMRRTGSLTPAMFTVSPSRVMAPSVEG